ncbi:alpha/beta fold hydrolase [Dyella sp. 2RAB6]|uniref:alpha/beta fold hydrolase n=1 Tax=Dyella sp. 2RAB6 TaxID=3232992 RepID=UPI003F8E6A11
MMHTRIKTMLGAGLLAAAALAWHAPAAAQPRPFPASFKSQEVQANGTTIHVRVGGTGPAVVLIHGFGDTGDMWEPLAVALARNHRVVVPDLRGMGWSAKPDNGYEKTNEAADIRMVLEALGIDHAIVVGHDLGAMVAYAYAARYPDKTIKLVVMDVPIPGIPPWEQLSRLPSQWHHHFTSPDALRLVQGRERIYLDRFWNEFSGDPARIDEATRAHYASLYALPGAMKAAFAQFEAFPNDAEANAESIKTKLTMPVLAIGGEKSFGSNMATEMRHAANDVTELVIPGAGHWLMEEMPEATIKAVMDFAD